MQYKIRAIWFFIVCVIALSSCSKDCADGKEGLDCNVATLSKFTGTWEGKNCDGAVRQITIESAGGVIVNIKNIFEGQVFTVKGSVNFTTIDVEPNQRVADGILMQECVIEISPDEVINIIYKLQDNTTSPANLTECRFDGTKIGENTSTNVPQVITRPVITTSDSTAESGGEIISNENGVTKRGICWSTSPNPTIDGGANFTDDVNNPFTSGMYDLQPGNTYYVRAYAVNGSGTGYGQELRYVKAECKDTLCIGGEYQGGIIAYFLENGDPGYDPNVPHGYLISLGDYDAEWGCANILVGNTARNLFAGFDNTDNIISMCNVPDIAAQKCRDLGADWFLPSLNEFEKAIENLGFGPFEPNEKYWTSSEESANKSWVISTTANPNTPAELLSKNNTVKVRAFKKF